jgi:predicted alpha/beta-hydrolase family hydrolase
MIRRLRIAWSPGQKVTGRLAMPVEPRSTGIVLAHGAGAGQEHPFMVHMRDGLAAAGFPTLTFNYPYTEDGRRAPDRLPKLLACHRACAQRLGGYTDGIILAGKSMGGRVGSHLAGDEGYSPAGLVYLGYPLVAMGKSEPRDTGHLRRIGAPQLFVSGTRDRLGPITLIRATARSVAQGSVIEVEQGDHSLRVPKRTGKTDSEVLGEVVEGVCRWIEAVSA